MNQLTRSEEEVVNLLTQDKSACEIGAIRNRSVYTVQKQIDNAKKKLEVNTAHGLTAKYIRISLAVLLVSLLLLISLLHTNKKTLVLQKKVVETDITI